MFSLFTLILVALLSTGFSNCTVPIIVLSFEGFHHKYMTETNTPFLHHYLFPKGSGPPYMTSILPPTTFVTHFTLSTGVYPKNHGVYNDEMFDQNGNVVDNEKSQFQFNENISPIWIENETAGKTSAVMMWPGSEFDYNEVAATYSQPYDEDLSWNDRVDIIVQWMQNSFKRPNLVMAYFEDTPCYNKKNQSEHFKDYAKKVNDTIRQVHNKLQLFLTKFDLIIMSDHGTEEAENFLFVDNLVSELRDELQMILSGPVVFVRPNDGCFERVLDVIMGTFGIHEYFEVYTEDKFPDYLKTNNLKGIIVVVANPGFTFLLNEEYQKLIKSVGDRNNLLINKNVAYSSVDQSMNAFFRGIGPSFKENVETYLPFNIIDVYALLKHLLKIPATKVAYQRKDTLNDIVKLILKTSNIIEINEDDAISLSL